MYTFAGPQKKAQSTVYIPRNSQNYDFFPSQNFVKITFLTQKCFQGDDLGLEKHPNEKFEGEKKLHKEGGGCKCVWRNILRNKKKNAQKVGEQASP